MDTDECIAAYKSGESLDSIADRVGISRTWLTKKLRNHVAIRKPGHTRPGPRELGPEWDELGLIPDEELSKKVGCSRQNVAKVRQTRGIPSFREVQRKNARADNTDGTDDV